MKRPRKTERGGGREASSAPPSMSRPWQPQTPASSSCAMWILWESFRPLLEELTS